MVGDQLRELMARNLVEELDAGVAGSHHLQLLPDRSTQGSCLGVRAHEREMPVVAHEGRDGAH